MCSQGNANECNVNEYIDAVMVYVLAISLPVCRAIYVICNLPCTSLMAGIVFGVWLSIPTSEVDKRGMVHAPHVYASVSAGTTILLGGAGFACHKLLGQLLVALIPTMAVFLPCYFAYLAYALRYKDLRANA